MRPRSARLLLPLALAAAVHGTVPPALAQGHARDLIQRGRELFEDQQYEESIQTLSGAVVRPQNTLAQKIEIYRLLALDHITLGHKEEAENFVRALLALQPDYELPRSESPRFRDFFAAVRAKWEAEGRPGLATEPSAAPKPVAIKHSSPSEAAPGTEVTLTAALDDPGHRTRQVELFYRAGSAGRFTEVTAQFAPAEGSVRATLPSAAVQPPYVAYYLLAKDAAGLPLASSGDADAPLRIPVPEPSKGWVLPVVVGGAVVGVAGIVLGSLALAGVFKGRNEGPSQSTVTIGVMTFR
jgi:hypothetical protein